MKTNNILKNFLITISLLSYYGSNIAYSEDKIESITPQKKWHLSLGYGVAVKNNIRKDNLYSGAGNSIILNHIPLVQIGWGPISVGAQGLTASFIGDKNIAGYFNINRAGDRYYGIGMESRKDSWFFGAGLKYMKYNFLMTKDINGRSHGIKATINYSVIYPIGVKIFARSSIGIECFSRMFSDYYYGVKANESTSTRAVYQPKAYCAPGASFFPGYKVNEELSLLMGISLKGIPKTVSNSPTTDNSWLESAVIMGATWKL
jgi:outer membrane protein